MFFLIRQERKENVGNTYKMDTNPKMGKNAKCLEAMLLKRTPGNESQSGIFNWSMQRGKNVQRLIKQWKGLSVQGKLYKVRQASSNSL